MGSRGSAKCGIGLGLADHWDNTGPRVSDIVPYSPAAEAKVFNKGDKVVTVDGHDVRGKRVEAVKVECIYICELGVQSLILTPEP